MTIAMKAITVQVTQDHIDRGRPCHHASCPIALAMSDLELGEPSVSSDTFSLLPGNDFDFFKYGNLTKRAQHFIDAFDSRGPSAVTPSTFRLWVRS